MAERVVFTLDAAERIANVVRQVEAGDRDESPLTFRRVDFQRQRNIRMARFSGPWPLNDSLVVTFLTKTTEPNTALAYNKLINLPDVQNRNCVIAKDGSAWYLVNWQWETAYAATAATLTTSALEFKTLLVGAVSNDHTSVFSVAITTCATATTE